MVTKNFKNGIIAWMTNTYGDIIKTDGTTIKMSSYTFLNVMGYASNMSAIQTVTANKAYCLLGSGTTKETDVDNDLENPITTLTCDSFSATKIGFDNNVSTDEKINYVATFTNTTSGVITVSEIGIYLNVASGTPILLYRKTFDSITFAPGETRTFTITLS